MNLNEFIIEYRKRNGLSQRQLAARCGLTNGYISLLEAGVNPKTGRPTTPTFESLKRLADGMDIDLMKLLAEVDDFEIDLNSSTDFDFMVVEWLKGLDKDVLQSVLTLTAAPDVVRNYLLR